MISETIYNGKEVVFSMADIQHIEKQKRPTTANGDFIPNGAFLITKHTTYNREVDGWENPIWISEEELPSFMKAWCFYRSEVDYPEPSHS
jgi:hypothetical protein